MKAISQPLMQFEGIDIYQLRDVPEGKKLVRLTKWLPAVQSEMKFLRDEYKRIMCDRLRYGMIVYAHGEVALYVNDLTNGEFDTLLDEK